MFGICFTLLVLILLTSFLDHLFGARYPELKRSRTLYVFSIEERDSETGFSRKGALSIPFFEKYIRKMKAPEKVALASNTFWFSSYQQEKRLKFSYKYTDPDFWDIMDFKFLAGHPYTWNDIKGNAFGVVVSESFQKIYYGNEASAIGQTFVMGNKTATIIGVVEDSPSTRVVSSASVYLPHNMFDDLADPSEVMGNFNAILLAHVPGDKQLIQVEFEGMLQELPGAVSGRMTYIAFADSILEVFSRNMLGDQATSGKTTFFLLIGIFAIMFMVLPAINLINININRMMERVSEIGIRRAFGASSKHLVYQFLVENTLITLMGGGVALLLAYLILTIINWNQIYGLNQLTLNWNVFGIAVLVSLFFGMLSGVYPAWRMSKLKVTHTLSGIN
ncbi:MAG TPA: ABC transporter permease [Saprospiraceae bacterium]|nr:ABC transporter permease [Saprospiraceae bacterium]HMQ82305.1 ABC transporter permease [Saprospiraceae bacterium]